MNFIFRWGRRKNPTSGVLGDVAKERQRQHEIWGVQSHPNNTGPEESIPGGHNYEETLEAVRETNEVFNNPSWDTILLEEVFEALVEKKPRPLRRELVEAAAVCVAWIEDLDSRSK